MSKLFQSLIAFFPISGVVKWIPMKLEIMIKLFLFLNCWLTFIFMSIFFIKKYVSNSILFQSKEMKTFFNSLLNDIYLIYQAKLIYLVKLFPKKNKQTNNQNTFIPKLTIIYLSGKFVVRIDSMQMQLNI